MRVSFRDRPVVWAEREPYARGTQSGRTPLYQGREGGEREKREGKGVRDRERERERESKEEEEEEDDEEGGGGEEEEEEREREQGGGETRGSFWPRKKTAKTLRLERDPSSTATSAPRLSASNVLCT